MTSPVVARQLGDDYQARIFWLEACRLFSKYSKVERVAYELKRYKAFDDVVVSYASPIPDERGGTVTADYYQAKYHVDLSGDLTWKSLIDPKAIGATSFSLLERLHAATTEIGSSGARFNLISAWPVHSGDELTELVSRRNGEIRLEKLFDETTDRSSKGKIRKAWRERLQLRTNEELEKVLAPFRIHAPYRSLEELRKELNFRLEFAGLKPVDDGHVGHRYDELIRKFHGNGVNEFDRGDLKTRCEGEGLWIGREDELSDRIQIGIRSFLRFAEHLEDETEHLLCLLRFFDVRHIRDPSSWQGEIAPLVKSFLSANTNPSGRYLLHLNAHSSIALIAGHVLNTKSGRDVALVQRGAGRTAIWEFEIPAPPKDSAVSIRVEDLRIGADDVAVAFSVTNEISSEVRDYVNEKLPTVGKLVLIAAAPAPGQFAVRNAAHAFQIAEGAVSAIRVNRPPRGGLLHFFSSAPNTAIFFFGRMTAGLGQIQAYEYLFESGVASEYVPSVRLPVA